MFFFFVRVGAFSGKDVRGAPPRSVLMDLERTCNVTSVPSRARYGDSFDWIPHSNIGI